MLKWLAGKMEVELKLDVKPSGSFTGQLTGLTPDRAFDRIHGVLLERGFYMLNINGFLIVKLLADGMPVTLSRAFRKRICPISVTTSSSRCDFQFTAIKQLP